MALRELLNGLRRRPTEYGFIIFLGVVNKDGKVVEVYDSENDAIDILNRGHMRIKNLSVDYETKQIKVTV